MNQRKRYSAKLLFQFRTVREGTAPRRRLCEERIVSFEAKGPRMALRRAKTIGRKSEDDYANAAGGRVYFEFLGVIELIDMSAYAGSGEVWYELVERLDPDKRLDSLLTPESDLHALRT